MSEGYGLAANESHTCVSVLFAEGVVEHGAAGATAVTRDVLALLLLGTSLAFAAVGMPAARASVALLGAAAGATLAVATPEWRDLRCSAAVAALVVLSLVGAGVAACLLRLGVAVAGFAMFAFFAATLFRAFPGLDDLGPPAIAHLQYAGWHLVPFWASVAGAGGLGAVAAARTDERTLGRCVAALGGCGAAVAADEWSRVTRARALPGAFLVALVACVSLGGVAAQEWRRRRRERKRRSG